MLLGQNERLLIAARRRDLNAGFGLLRRTLRKLESKLSEAGFELVEGLEGLEGLEEGDSWRSC